MNCPNCKGVTRIEQHHGKGVRKRQCQAPACGTTFLTRLVDGVESFYRYHVVGVNSKTIEYRLAMGRYQFLRRVLEQGERRGTVSRKGFEALERAGKKLGLGV